MTLQSRIAAPFKAAGSGLKALMNWSGRATWGLMWALRTKFDYQKEVGDGSRSSIVMSVLLWMSRTFPEAPLFVGREQLLAGLELERIPGHPMTRLIEQPNKFYSGVLLWMATIIDWALTGNGYWIKVRSGADIPVELWWVPSHMMEPKWPDDGTVFISHYDYKPDPVRRARRIEVRDVVHFRYGMDPNNTRKGRTVLATLLREIFTDEEASNMTAALMKNLGVPGVIIAPDSPDAKVSDEATREVKDEFVRDFAGDNRGEPMVMKGPTKVSVLSWSPDQMNLRDLRRIPEERVTAIYGVAAVVVGLGAGLDRSTFANFHEAREAAYESNIIPTQRLFAADLRSQLLPDFESDPEVVPAFDLSQVRVLQPDMDKLYERVNKGVNGGWLTEGDARRAVGMPTRPEHDRYLRPLHITEVPAGGRRAEMPLLPADPDNPANKSLAGGALKALPDRIAQIRATIAERFEPDLELFFAQQANRVRSRITGAMSANGAGKALFAVNQLLPASEDDALKGALRPLWMLGLEQGWNAAGETFGLTAEFSPDAQAVNEALKMAEVRAERVIAATREDLDAGMLEAEQRGLSVEQLVSGVEASDDAPAFKGLTDRTEQHFAGYAGTLARTEAMWATNMGTLAVGTASGFARVKMHDATDHEPCASRNGKIVSSRAAAIATDREHASGTLSFEPVE